MAGTAEAERLRWKKMPFRSPSSHVELTRKKIWSSLVVSLSMETFQSFCEDDEQWPAITVNSTVYGTAGHNVPMHKQEDEPSPTLMKSFSRVEAVFMVALSLGQEAWTLLSLLLTPLKLLRL